MGIVVGFKGMTDEEFERLIAANENANLTNEVSEHETRFYDALLDLLKSKYPHEKICDFAYEIYENAQNEVWAQKLQVEKTKRLRKLKNASSKAEKAMQKVMSILLESRKDPNAAFAFDGFFGLIQNKCSLQNAILYFRDNNKRLNLALKVRSLKHGPSTSSELRCAIFIAHSFNKNFGTHATSRRGDKVLTGKRNASVEVIRKSDFDRVCDIVQLHLEIRIPNNTRYQATKVAKKTRGESCFRN